MAETGSDPYKLTPAQKETFQNWLHEKAGEAACPVCQANSWIIGEHLVNFPVFAEGDFLLGGAAYPAVLLVCSNCAYARHFMAAPMGLTTSPGA